MRPEQRADEPVTDAVAEVLDPAAPASTLPLDPDVAVPHAPVAAVPLTALVAGCGVAAAVLTVLVLRRSPSMIAVDVAVHDWVLTHRGALDASVARTVTWAGSTFVALPALLVAGCLAPPGLRGARARLSRGLLVAGSASVGVYAGLALNHLVGRERPPTPDWWGAAGGPAFPSGHTTVATIVAIDLAWVLSERWTSRRARRIGVVSALVMTAAVGWSRIWLGVHWPSDVAAGWLLGSAWAAASIGALRWLRRHAAPPHDH